MLPLAGLLLTANACERGESDAGRQYRVQCDIRMISTLNGPLIHAEGTGATFDEGGAGTWADACGQLGLEESCREGNEDDFRGFPTCGRLTVLDGTGLTAAEEPGYNCQMDLEDRRTLRPIEHSAEAVLPEEAANADAFCLQTIIEACARAGMEFDCTGGESPAYRIQQRSASRSLIAP
jgi:hypothetical protein